MALNNLKITVVDGGKTNSGMFGGGEEQDDPAKAAPNKWKKSGMYKMLNLNQTIKHKVQQKTSPTTFFAVQQGVGLATQTARQFANYYISDIGRRNGDSNYQAIVNRRIEQVTDALSIGQGMLGGAMAGSAAGPAGAAIGAVLGAASSGISLGFKYAERERAYAHQMFEESTSQAYNLARAGNSALTGRLR